MRSLWVSGFMWIVILQVVLIAGSIEPAAAQGTLDQQWAPPFGGAGWNWVGAHQPIGQSFIPTLSVLLAVDVGLENTGSGTQRLAIQIRENSISGPYYSQTGGVEVPPGGPIWIHVELVQPLPVTPGKTYVLALYTDPGLAPNVRWYITIPGGGYPGGNAITDGINQPDGDYFFRTYGTATGTTTPASAAFDYSLILSPSSVTVKQGGTANYVILLSYSDPSYSGTIINIQLTGLGPGMDYQLSQSGALTITTSPSTPTGTYTLTVVGSALGVTHQTSGTLTVTQQSTTTHATSAAPITDWALSNLRITPSSPNVGDQVVYAVDLAALSTNSPYPQTVYVNWWVDGTDGNGQSVTYYGPTGATQTITFNNGEPNLPNQWTATAGAHRIGATADLKPKYNDPDRSNNEVSLTITVGTSPFDYSVTVSPSTESVEVGGSASYVVSVFPLAGSPVPVSLTVMGLPGNVRSSFTTQSATPPYTSTLNLDLSTSSANAGAYTLTVVATAAGNVKSATATLMIQQKATQSQTTTSQTATSGSNLSGMLQQNLLPLLVLLAVVVALLSFMLGRRGRGQTAVGQQIDASCAFCAKCGAENPAANEFCGSCGNKLKSS